MYSKIIGHDASLLAIDDHYSGGTAVKIESSSSCVYVSGPFIDWAGYQVLAEMECDEAADALAQKIAADPLRELDLIGYDTSSWFVPATNF